MNLNSKRTFIIAEAGVNHNGILDNAIKLIDLAYSAGVDAIKFQNYRTEELSQRELLKESYQAEGDNDKETQYEMLKRFELDKEFTVNLMNYAEEKGIMFMSTPYDRESVDLLLDLGLDILKIGSGEITDLPFLDYVASKNIPLIISTGASTLKEVDEAVNIIIKHHSDLTLLHCTSSYPAPMKEVNLRAMLTIKDKFNLVVGYSDHTLGSEVPIAAVAMGAKIIEKHITLDKNMPGPDHKASLNEDELTYMVQCIRNLEEAMGDGIKKPTSSEQETISMGRRSIVTQCFIPKGEVITASMLGSKRPGTGLPPANIVKILGKCAKKDIKKDCLMKFEYIRSCV
jgi:N-acetylneuraminate synthase